MKCNICKKEINKKEGYVILTQVSPDGKKDTKYYHTQEFKELLHKKKKMQMFGLMKGLFAMAKPMAKQMAKEISEEKE